MLERNCVMCNDSDVFILKYVRGMPSDWKDNLMPGGRAMSEFICIFQMSPRVSIWKLDFFLVQRM